MAAVTMRTDPLRNFKFRVQIIPNATDTNLATTLAGIDEIGFAQVSGLAVSNQVIEYREGGMNTHPHKFVGQSDYTPVAFARGVFAKQDQLYKWQKFMHAWMGGGIGGGTDLANADQDYRCSIIVKVYDHPHTNSVVVPTGGGNNQTLKYAYDGDTTSSPNALVVPGAVKLQYKLFNCWPGSFSLSDLSAQDTTGIMVQTMNIHHEGFYIDWTGAENLANI